MVIPLCKDWLHKSALRANCKMTMHRMAEADCNLGNGVINLGFHKRGPVLYHGVQAERDLFGRSDKQQQTALWQRHNVGTRPCLSFGGRWSML